MEHDSQEAQDTRMKMAFVEEYAKHGIIAKACRAVGITRSVYNRWKEEDEDFVQLCADAHEDSIDLAEAEFRKRAVEGVEEPVLWQGQPVWKRDPETGHIMLDDDFEPIPLTVTVRSDKLLETYMKGQRAKYGNKVQHEHGGVGGGPIKATIEFVDANEGRPADEESDEQDADQADPWS